MSRKALITRSVLGITLLGGVALAVGAQATPSSSYSVHGVDISKYQHPGGAAINWAQVKAAGEKFVIVGATQGTSSTPANPYFNADYAAVKANGLIRGAYHFATPTAAAGEAAAEAKAFMTAIGGTKTHEAGDMAPILDLETRDGLTDAQLVTWTQQFASEVFAESGRQPIVYVSACFFATGCSGVPSSLKYLPTWIAAYTSASSPTAQGWSMWQYSSSTTVAGISGAVDTDVFNSSQSALVNTFGDGRTPAIVSLWGVAGGMNGSLGAPTGDETQIASGAWEQVYAKGAIVWSSSTGAYPLYGAMLTYWKSNTAAMGLPTGNSTATPGGVYQAFQSADAHYDSTSGQINLISGDVRKLWYASQSHGDGLGVAQTPMTSLSGLLSEQQFENGIILQNAQGMQVVWTDNVPAGAHAVADAADGGTAAAQIAPDSVSKAADGAIRGRAR